ncbi:MAG: hypothetical protein Q4A64_00245 [Porphyromonadaceae bacterium]|nr:hypothetical protein [Porphyromonadaceae bacterium]
MNKSRNSKKLASGILALTAVLATACSQSSLEPKLQTEDLVPGQTLELSTIDRILVNQTEYDLKSDSLVLVSLYKAMGGASWFRNENWLTSEPLENWHGVHTKEVDGKQRVYALYIGGNNLRGAIPSSIKYLTALHTLQLKHNYHIEGSIPEGIFDLVKLRTLDLSFTGVTGELSSKVGQLTDLDSLNLWTGPWDLRKSGQYLPNPRRLSGTLPKELGKLSKARYISVYNQNFSGQIPSELSGLTSVEELSLQGNAFSGNIPASLGNLQRVRKLYLGENKLVGTIPSELCNTATLEELILSHNQLEGSLPQAMAKWQRLNLLDVNSNRLSGELPAELADMKDLFKLDIRNNGFEGSLPVRLGGEQQDFLRFVDVRNNNLSGAFPAKVAHKLRELEPNGVYPFSKFFYTEYRISGNRFSGELPTAYQDVDREFILPQQSGYSFANYK